MFHKLFSKLILGCVEFLTLSFGGGGGSPAAAPSGGNDALWGAQANQVNQSGAMSGELFDYWRKYAPGYLDNTAKMNKESMDGTLTTRMRNQSAADANSSLGMGLDAAKRDMSRYGSEFNPTKVNYSLRDAGLSGALTRSDAMNKTEQWGEGQKWARNQDALGQVSGMPGNATQMANSSQAGMNNMGSMQNNSNAVSAQNSAGYGRAGASIASALVKKDGGAINLPRYACGGHVKARRLAEGGFVEQLSAYGPGEVTTRALGNTPDKMSNMKKLASISGDPIGVKVFADGGRVNRLAVGGSPIPTNPVMGFRERMAAMPTIQASNVQNNTESPAASMVSGAAPTLAMAAAKEVAAPYAKQAWASTKDAAAKAYGEAKANMTPDASQAPADVVDKSSTSMGDSGASTPLEGSEQVVSPTTGGEGLTAGTEAGSTVATDAAATTATDAAATTATDAAAALATDATATAGTEAAAAAAAEALAAQTAATAATTTAASAAASGAATTAGTVAAANAWNPVGWGMAAAGLIAAIAGSRKADGGSMENEPSTRSDMLKGGRVSGPGTETSDSIPAWLSNDEYVANADAVKLPKDQAEAVVDKWKKSGSSTKGLLEMINEKGLQKRYGPQARMVDGDAKPNGLAEGGSSKYGKRPDGSEKGEGYFGPLTTSDGKTMTELTADSDGEYYPLVTPNQGFKDLSSVLMGNKPSDEMHDKAIEHARSRKSAGRSVYAEEGEQGGYKKANGLSLGGMLGIAMGAGADQLNVQRGQDRADEILALQKAGEQRTADEFATKQDIRKRTTDAAARYGRDIAKLDKNSPTYLAEARKLRNTYGEEISAINPDSAFTNMNALNTSDRADELIGVHKQNATTQEQWRKDQIELGNKRADIEAQRHREALGASAGLKAQLLAAKEAELQRKELTTFQGGLKTNAEAMFPDKDEHAAVMRTLAVNADLTKVYPGGSAPLLAQASAQNKFDDRMTKANSGVNLFGTNWLGKPALGMAARKLKVNSSGDLEDDVTGHKFSRSDFDSLPADERNAVLAIPSVKASENAYREIQAEKRKAKPEQSGGSSAISGAFKGTAVDKEPSAPSQAGDKIAASAKKGLGDFVAGYRNTASRKGE